ncbi:hypothetical protein HGRIS_000374 [Hohenbuehelia grisea]|uniref:Amidase domain-containing protein n=1 Tax=Hohenbuehelia grisea TaxID=104357 RepID=A0ABR3JS10_9AGAR
MLSYYSAHRKACRLKQQERLENIKQLDPVFHEPLTSADLTLLATPIAALVAGVQAKSISPQSTLVAYAKKALLAHAATNCLTEILFTQALTWAAQCNTSGPLAGVPVSLKDTVGIAGVDSCTGYAAWAGRPFARDSALVRLLRDAGAVPFTKTAVPTTLLSFESASDVHGRATNPHNPAYSPGGSTGGEAALLAFGGSRVGVGTDVAGSVRVPAHYCGIYTVRASAGRFLKAGNATSMPGQEGVPAVYSPMARTLEDLETFWRGVMAMKPWEYDPSVLPIPWRELELASEKASPRKWGVIWDDGVIAPSPACHRALQTVVDTLRKNGEEVVTLTPPSSFEGLKLAAQLLLADGGRTATKPILPFESNDPGMHQALRMFRLPRLLKRIYAFYLRYIARDPLYAELVEVWHEKRVDEYLALVGQREAYRGRWFEYWREEGLDYVLTVPNALPAVPHGGMKDGWKACGYTFLWNLLDYTAGVLPVTHVNGALDRLPRGAFKPRNAIERDTYKMYDPVNMSGLPVGVQIVGQRLEEEKVLQGMRIVEGLLRKEGLAYDLLEF